VTRAAQPPPATGPPGLAFEPDLALAATVAALRVEVNALQERVARLEAGREPAVPATAAPDLMTAAPAADLGSGLGLAGRTLIALGGGYLLRAATETGAVAGGVGAALGLLYALGWVVAGHRALVRGHTASGMLGAATAVLVAYPLLWESVARFHAVGARPALLAAVVFALLAGALGLRHGRPELAWAHAAAATMLALALLVATHDLVAAALALALLHVGSELGARRPGGPGLPWLTAPAVLVALLAILFVAARPGGPPPGYPPLLPAHAGLLVVGVSAALLLRSGHRAWRQPLGAYDALLSALALAVAVSAVVRLLPEAAVACGVLALAVAVTIDAALVARTFPPRSAAAFAAGAALLTMAATSVLLSLELRVAAWCLWGLAATARGRTIPAHRITGSAFLLAALSASGALAAAGHGLAARSAPPALVPVAALAAASAVLGWMLLRGPVAAVVGALGAMALLRNALPSHGMWVVAGGTVALAILCTVLLVLSRRLERTDLRVAGTVILCAGGARLLLVDLPGGRPAPLFLSLVTYGAALMLAQALRLRKTSA
jgi:hypothetical protein